jgi:putative transposase
MSRRCRVSAPNAVHHVYNRGNRKAVIFQKRDDYRAFFSILEEAQERFRMRMLSYCVMRNHWHLVLWPDERVSISTYMHWVTTTHVQRYHAHYGLTGTGHLYQDRFQNPICRDNRGVLAVMRYVEANPLTAHLVQRAEDWEWSSLRLRLDGDAGNLLVPGPVPLPENWTALVNETRPKHIAAAHRACQPRDRKKRKKPQQR